MSAVTRAAPHRNVNGVNDLDDKNPSAERLRLAAEYEFLDLAGGGLGERAEDHGPRHLEARESLAAEGDHLIRGGLPPRLQGHERAGALAPFLVGPRHHGGFHHGRML